MAQAFNPVIPHAWDDREVETFEVPLAQPDRSARYLSAAEYYALDVMPIYRSYPVYAPGREPAGYMQGLKDKEPEIVFDPAKLHTQEDWIRAGAIVFRSAREYRPPENLARNTDAIRSLQILPTREGIMPFSNTWSGRKATSNWALPPALIATLACWPTGRRSRGAKGAFRGRDLTPGWPSTTKGRIGISAH